MRAGDLVGLYGGCYRLAIAIDNQKLTIIYDSFDKSINFETINDFLASSLKRIASENLPLENFEIYKTNIYDTTKLYGKTLSQYFDFLVLNLKKFCVFVEGDILRMEGLKFMQHTIYNHQVIFSGQF